MKRATTLLTRFVLFSISLCSTSGLMLAQAPSPIPPYVPDILGPDLIAWSEQQKPQPVPSPLPDPPEKQQRDQQAASSSNQKAESQPAAQSFIGTIMKDHNKYVLRMSAENTYQLDDQRKASQYEGQRVRLVGTVDSDGHNVRVISIDLIS